LGNLIFLQVFLVSLPFREQFPAISDFVQAKCIGTLMSKVLQDQTLCKQNVSGLWIKVLVFECIVLHPAGDTNLLYQALDDNVCGLRFLGGSGTASAVATE
jgi:hypothetical protein